MMSRRSNGEGSVYRSKDGSGWIAAIELPAGPNGKRIRRRRRANTKAAARSLLREMQTEFVLSGSIGDPHRSLSDSISAFLALRASEGLSAKTLEMDSWRAGIVLRGLGHKRVQSLTVSDCDSFLVSAAQGEFSTTATAGEGRIATAQLRRVRGFLVRALRNEMRLGLVHRNVAELSALPQSIVETRRRRALSVRELESLRAAANGGLAILIELSGRYGLRPAESRAMLWSDLDRQSGLLHVGDRLNREDERIGPKTRAAARTLQLDGGTLAHLDRWEAEQVRQRSSAGPAWVDTGLIVTSAAGSAIQYRNVQRALTGLCQRAGIQPAVSHYELRHTAITFQAEAGHSAWQIADWSGTSERMIADVYRHKLTDTSPLGPAI